MKKRTIQNGTKAAALFLLGAVALSNLSSYILLRKLHFPVYIPELLIIPFLPFFLKDLRRYLFPILRNPKVRSELLMVAYGCFMVFLYSIPLNGLGVHGAASTWRGYFYILIFMVIVGHARTVNTQAIYIVVLGVAVGTLLRGYLVGMETAFSESYRNYPNIMALFLLIAIPLAYRKAGFFMVSMALGVLLCLESEVRRPIIVILAAMLGVLFVVGMKKKFRFYRKIGVVIFIMAVTVLTGLYYPKIADLINLDDLKRMHVIQDTIYTIQGRIGLTGDYARLHMIASTIGRFWKMIIPHGFIAKHTSVTGRGIYTDFPVYELFYTFGSLGTVVLLLYLLYRFIRKLREETKKAQISFDTVCAASIVLFPLLLGISGTFLYFTYELPFTGIILGRVLYSRKRYKNCGLEVPEQHFQ